MIKTMKPVNVSIIPPTLNIKLGFINEKTIPCINLPTVKMLALRCKYVEDKPFSSAISIKIKNSGAYSIKLP